MKLTLSDVANWAQILSLPLSVALWYFTRDKAAKFWRRWLNLILSAFAVLTLITLWRVGWLDWLTHQITLPVWALILLSFSALAIALGSATPHCRFEINDRCLLALEEIEYPVEALKAKASGTVTLAGTVARDGKMTGIQVAEANTSSAEWKDLFVREAVTNLKTWRLEAAEHKDLVRITYTYSMDSSLAHPGQVDVDLALPTEVRIRGRAPHLALAQSYRVALGRKP